MKRDHLVIPGWVDEESGLDYHDLLEELCLGGTAAELVEEVLRNRWNAEVVSRLEAEAEQHGIAYVVAGPGVYDTELEPLALGDRALPLMDSPLDLERECSVRR
jgi:hypothetical protein